MIKDVINETKTTNKKYPFNKLFFNKLHEDFIDDFDDEEEDIAHGMDNIIAESTKYYTFIEKLKDIVNNILKQIDGFPIKLYQSTSVLASKSAASLSYDDVIKDLSAAQNNDLIPFNSISSKNFDKRQQEKENAINTLASADCINSEFGIASNSNSSYSFPKYARRDTIIDLAERLVVYKHSLDEATDYINDRDRTDEENLSFAYCAIATLSAIMQQFRLSTMKSYKEFSTAHPNNGADYLGGHGWTRSNSSSISAFIAVVLEYLNHNCRQIPDTHISPLVIPDSIPIADKSNSRNSNKSLKRFAYESTLFENCVTTFDEKQLQYEFSKTNDRVKNSVFNICKTTDDKDPNKADFSKLGGAPGYVTYEKISNLDFHKNIVIGDNYSDYEKFNISTHNVKNWFLRLFNLYTYSPNSGGSGSSSIESVFMSTMINTSITPTLFGIISKGLVESKYGDLQGYHVWRNMSNTDDRNEVNKKFPVKYIYDTYFSDLMSDFQGGAWRGSAIPTLSQNPYSVGSVRFYESLVFDELKKTNDKRAALAIAINNTCKNLLKSKKSFNIKSVSDFVKWKNSLQKISDQDFYLNVQRLKQVSKSKKADSLSGFQKALTVDPEAPLCKSLIDYITIIRPDLADEASRATVISMSERINSSTPKEAKDYVERYSKLPGKSHFEYTTPLLGLKSRSILVNGDRIKFSLEDLFAESFDELIKAASQFTLYDSENKIYDYELIDILKQRSDFGTQLHSQYAKNIDSLIQETKIDFSKISKYVSDYNFSTEELIKKLVSRGPSELSSIQYNSAIMDV